MIERIDFSSKAAAMKDYHVNNAPITSLDKISNINFFVGPNNSGKSRFLRNLMKMFSRYVSPKFEDRVALPKEGQTGGLFVSHIDSSQLIEKMKPILDKVKIISNDLYTELLKDFTSGNVFNEKDLVGIYNKFSILTYPRSKNMERFSDEAVKLLSDLKDELKTLFEAIFELPSGSIFAVTYIPSFRSLRKFERFPKTDIPRIGTTIDLTKFEEILEPILATRSFKDYFIQREKDLSGFNEEEITVSAIRFRNIFSGETLFDQIKELRNGTEDKRDILNGFEEFLSTKFFNGEKVHLNSIDANGIKEVYVKIGSEKEFPIFNLGDGIQAIIVLVFPLFYYRDYRHIIFYEEPELYLHPGMQRIFIDGLRSFKSTTSFLVTHSNHILDTSFDYKDEISIFSFEKKLHANKAIFNVNSLSSPDLSLLNLLGVRNSSIFLSNCCIWVEGVSDRIYINKYLVLYMKYKGVENPSFYEDLHYSFLEFGGNQIVHYDFADKVEAIDGNKINALKITNRMMLIHDSDENKETRHKLLSSQLGNNYFRLQVREIENLIAPSTIIRLLDHYKKKESEEFKIDIEIKQEDYANVPFGKFISTYINSGQIKKICTPATPKTTPVLYNKADFALTATGFMNSWDELSADAQALAIKVYEFIKSNNSK